jgi:hypothetical protein
MRPDWRRISVLGLVLYILTVGIGQLAMGTIPAFTGLVIVYAILWATAVWAHGGVLTLLGACTALFGAQHVLVSQIAKVFLGQRPDIPLYHPVETMAINAVAMAGLLAAAMVLRLPFFMKAKSILQPEMRLDQLRVMTLVFTVLMAVRYIGAAGIGGPLRFLIQFDFLTPLAVACATAYTVLESKGKRLLSPWVIISAGLPLVSGIVFSQRKEAAYAFVILVLTAALFGFRFRTVHILAVGAVLAFFQIIIFPYALYARSEITGRTFGSNFSQATDMFMEVLQNPRKFQERAKDPPPPSNYAKQRLYYYGEASPTLDRLSLITTVDILVHSAKNEGHTGWKTISRGFEMVVPRALNPDKNPIGTSNWLARRGTGLVGPTDFKTAITMGFVSEAFVAFGWTGVILIPFITCLAFFTVFRIAVHPAMKNNLWSCAFAISLPWVFSEGTLQQQVIQVIQNGPLIAVTGAIIVIFANTMVTKKNLNSETAAQARMDRA